MLVIGEAIIDIVITGTSREEHVGGSPANVALGLGRRGVDVTLLTQLGRDPRGHAIIEHLENSGVTVQSGATDLPTSTATARIGNDGQATYTFDVHWNEIHPETDVTPAVIHTGSIAAFLQPGASSIHQFLAHTRADEITFDPNIRADVIGSLENAWSAFEALTHRATVVKLSDQDAAWLFPGSSIEEVATRLLQMGPRLVAVTRGEHGAVLANHSHLVKIAAARVKPVDTIGAGDTFMASLIHSVLHKGSARLDISTLEKIGAAAVHASALTVSRRGADLPWEYELPTSSLATVGSIQSSIKRSIEIQTIPTGSASTDEDPRLQ